MINRYVITAAIFALLAVSAYVWQFHHRLEFGISPDPAVWGQLGDYIGGLLNPALSFISLVLLIKSLSLQNEANRDLRDEIRNNRKTESLRSFEAHLFNMLDSQKAYFESMTIKFGKPQFLNNKSGAEAVIEIEDKLETIRWGSNRDKNFQQYLDWVDSRDQLYGVTRIFYVMVKMIDEKLSDSKGFNLEDRRAHFLTLINFTDFSLLRLIMITMQFMKFESTDYLRKNKEFEAVLNEVGLKFDLY
ncbi:hypothetical protein [Pseudomonas sp. SCB32]|uniref:hypothetical protein n=1 Tax=Pseudomonas sp. SCB32 TaxID=2653853 RepID=UPI001264E186|nr:hypothetical protein [Pseudomonas sp. SCB32]